MEKMVDISEGKNLISFLSKKYAIEVLYIISKHDGATWTEIRNGITGERTGDDTITKRLEDLRERGFIRKGYIEKKDTNGYFIKDDGKEVLNLVTGLHKWVESKKPGKKGGTKSLSKFM